MLEPQSRTLLLDALRPPDGYRFDYGIGTTYSLDLITLLTTPLAFTWFDQGSEGEAQANALEVVESLRRYADRLLIFCHASRIHLPRFTPPQLEFLEKSIFECLPPTGGAFHSKVWVLRYSGEDQAVVYRFLCLSRNLTFARSWDTVLSMEGCLQQNRTYRRNEPLALFIQALPSFAIRSMPEAVIDRLNGVSEDLRRVDFAAPPEVEDFRFWPIGISPRAAWPLQDLGNRTLVISPFLDLKLLERISNGKSRHILVSTTEALSSLEHKPEGFDSFKVLDERAVAEIVDESNEAGAVNDSGSEPEMIELTGLHAKCYVTENGGSAHVWTGSANATEAAFTRNVEFLVQLSGRKKLFGIDTLLGETEDTRDLRFCDVLQNAEAIVASSGSKDDSEQLLDIYLERGRTALAKACFVAKVYQHGTEDRYDVELVTSAPDSLTLPDGMQVSCWPVTVSEPHSQKVAAGTAMAAKFASVTFEALTSFFAFRLDPGNQQPGSTFVLQIPMEGAPTDRHARVLRSIVSDRSRLLRFLMLLISGEESIDLLQDLTLRPDRENTGEMQSRPSMGAGLFESLVRTLDRAPDRIDDVARLLEDLGGERKALYSEEFDSIWSAIWAVRQQGKTCATK